jgi:hypothetical protein
MDYRQFSSKIKTKYPQYADMDDQDLAQKMVSKFPQYSDITFNDTSSQSQGKPQDWASKIYTPLIEGGAMAVGGTAGAVMGAPAGPVGVGLGGAGMAAAMYPPAKRFAASIDQMRGIQNPDNQPQTLPQQASSVASDFGTGLGIEAGGRAINAGTEAAAPFLKPIVRGAAQKMSKVGSFLSGAKPQDLMQAYDQGLTKTYGAPSMAKAGSIFENAAQKAGVNTTPTLEATLDPQLTQARQTAYEVGQKMQAGNSLTAQEALSARQAVDRIQAATPVKDKKTLMALGDLRDQFQEALAKVSPELQDASNTYRQAIVKRNLLTPVPVNKGGSPNKLTSELLGIGGGLTGAYQHSLEVPAAAAAGLFATSPLAQGVAAASTGSAARGTGQFLSSPAGGKTVASVVANKVLTMQKAKQYLQQAGGDKDKARELAKADGWSF